MTKSLRFPFSKNVTLVKTLCFLLLNLVCLLSVQAQVTIPPGNTANNPGDVTITRKPLGNFFGYERSAAIYLSSEIGQTGSITAIGFFVESLNNPAASTPVEIYLKETTASVFASNSLVQTEQAGATLVFSGNVTSAQLTAGSWITFTLSTPFNYTSNNLEVLVKTNGGGTGIEGADAKQFRFNFTGSVVYRFQYWQADLATPEANNQGGVLVDFRPNVQLTFAGAPPTCAAPTTVSGTGTGQNTAQVTFSGGDAGTSYTIEYGPSSTFPSGTTTTTASSSPANLSGLTAGTQYTFVVRTLCANGVTSANSPQGTFTTSPPAQPCDPPTNLNATNITTNSATLNFTPSSSGSSGTYTVEYGPVGFADGTGQIVTGPPYNVTGLSPNTTYDFTVEKDCGANGSVIVRSSFTTAATPQTCAAPTTVSGTGTGENTAQVTFSGGDAGTSYTIEYGPSSTFPSGTTTTTASSSPANLSGLTAGTQYTFVVRTLCANGVTSANSPQGTFTTTAPAQTCDPPTGLSATNITSTTADLNFTPSATGASGTYSIEYGPSGFTQGNGTAINNATSPQTVSNLSPSTTYQFYVTKNCGASGSSTAGPVSFTTTAAPVVCNDPSNLNATNITNTTADLAFTPSAGTGTYNVEYGPNGFTPGTGTVVNVSTSPASVSNLTANTTYQFYVTKNCGSGVFSNQVGPASFTTTNVAPVVCDPPTNLFASNVGTTTADLNFTPSATGSAGTYTLEYGPTGFSPGNGTVVPNATSPYNAMNLIPGISYDFYVTKNCSGTNSTTAGPATFTTSALPCVTGTWLGVTSTDWHTASNWCNNTIPDANTDVTIPGLTLFQPVISSNANTRNLTINSGATLILASGILTVNGLFTNNGTFDSNGGGSLIFPSSNPNLQVVGEPGITTIFRNLNAGTGGISLGGPVSIRELLTLNGNLTTNGQPFTLLSEPSNQAMVVNSGGVVNGATTVQRYINPGLNSGPGYRHFSSAVSNAVIGDLNDAGVNMVVNPAYNTNPTPGTTRPFPTVFRYNETRLTATNPDFTFGWESPSSLSDPMTPGRGFTVNTPPTTVDVNGTLNNGTISVGTLTRGSTAKSGWHMLGNPYPAPIDWDLVSVPAGMDNAVYVFRSSSQYSGSYVSYVNGIGTPGTELIGVMQGFFVRVNSGSPSFAFQNSYRVTTYENPAFYRQSHTETRPIAELSVKDNNGAGDHLFVYFQNGATTGFDGEYDAFKLPNSGNVASFYSVAGNDILSINGLPGTIPGTVVPLGGRVPQAGSYTITAEQLLNFKINQDIYLEDRTTGTLHNLRQQASYQFSTTQTDLSGRFFLRFGTAKTTGIAAADLATEVLLYPNPNNGIFTLSMPAFNGSATEAKLFNTVGQQVWQQTLKADGKQHIQETIKLDKLAAGVYTLRLETGAGPVTRKIVIE